MQEVLKKNYNSTRTFFTARNWNKHVSSWIDCYLFFSDDSIHAKIHLIINQTLANSSNID